MKTISKQIILTSVVVLLMVILDCCKKDNVPPAEVTDLNEINGASKITLIWTDPADNDFNRIEISFDDIIIYVSKGIQSKEISNLLDGKDYTFTVKTIDKKGNKSIGIQIHGIPDYRMEYTGEFVFTTISEFWSMGNPTIYDTITYDGNINIYAEGDSLKDLSSFDDPTENSKHKVTIEFLNNTYITPEITETGVFINKSGYHYNHSGNFSTKDSIKFYVGGLGGLGAGTNYSVSGNRK
jgi:hypothetical protein